MDEKEAANPLLSVFAEAKKSQLEADILYDNASDMFAELQRTRGVPSMLGKYMPLLKKYAPLLLAGGGGTTITALAAGDGAFSGLVNGLLTMLGIGPTV